MFHGDECETRVEVSKATLCEALLNGTSELIGVVSGEGRVVALNRTALEAAGLEREEADGRLLMDIPPWNSPSACEKLQGAIQKAWAGSGEAVRVQLTAERRDRRRRRVLDVHIKTVASPTIQESGTRLLIVEAHQISPPAIGSNDVKLAEEETARNERLYSTLVNSLGGIVWEAEAFTLKFKFVSPHAERILGEEWVSDPDFWIKHLHPEDREWVPGVCIAAAQSGRDHEAEYRMIAADGRVIWLYDLVTVSREPDGRTCLRGIMLDITERKRVEAALREGEERFRLIFERSTAGMLVTDLAGYPVQANRAFCGFMQRSEKELRQLTIPELVPSDDRPCVVEDMRGGHTIDDVRRYLRADGEVVWGHTTTVLLRPEGMPAYWIAVVQDVTAQKRAEELLRLSEERFRIVANDTPAYLWMTSSETQTSFINKPLAAFLGTDRTSLGDSWIECVHPEDRPWILAEFLEAFSQGRAISVECRIRRYDGEYRWVLDQALPRRSPNGDLIGHAGSLTDITEAKTAQAELRAAHDALANELAERRRAEEQIVALTDRLISAQEEERARIARELHDNLSQQIAAVNIMLSSLKRQIPERDSSLREQAGRAHQRLSEVAETIRNISHDLHPAILEHASLTAALRAHCSEFTALSGVEVRLHANDAFTNLPGDVSLCIYRVAQEALQNVMKHSGTKSAHLSLVRMDRSVCLTVEDRGCGFEVHRSSASSGLGLVSMRERVKLVHGRLELMSKPLEGTRVKACVPVSS